MGRSIPTIHEIPIGERPARGRTAGLVRVGLARPRRARGGYPGRPATDRWVVGGRRLSRPEPADSRCRDAATGGRTEARSRLPAVGRSSGQRRGRNGGDDRLAAAGGPAGRRLAGVGSRRIARRPGPRTRPRPPQGLLRRAVRESLPRAALLPPAHRVADPSPTASSGVGGGRDRGRSRRGARGVPRGVGADGSARGAILRGRGGPAVSLGPEQSAQEDCHVTSHG
jgi:hypothetical protein